ncbi:MAG: NAD-dependent epimerase/dehydratase family protein [Chloroflexi bacterium]|nr:NAD-dependent epimerase/dehydratase family protein [Chloroflexota bacterium]
MPPYTHLTTMSAPVLITGATGFLGHTLCPYLIERGYQLRALVRPTSSWDFLRPLGVELAWGDIRDAESVRTAAVGCRAVVHAAGKFRFWGTREDFFAVNLEGTRNALEAARQANAERFVFISTIAVAGTPRADAVIDETYPPTPGDDYQCSKLEAERLTLRYHQEYGLPTVVLRPGAFYGPGSRYAFNRLFFEDPLKGLPLQVHRGQRINFPVYIQDVAQGIDLALQRGRPGQVYNISGPSLSHQKANDVVDNLLGHRIWRFNAPRWTMLALARAWTWLSRYTGQEPYYPFNLSLYVFHDWKVSCEKAERELGFVPTPFEEGARATLEWYHELGVGPTNWLARLITWLTWRKL